ncbi:putative kunitz-type protease inhibitor [Schistosoma mansoni]|uniref:Putative kunitz-type protease inhibitor n=1 Tax=Schistosoma mansoni TaxID=6183 RepID=G4VED8_SCHMA|nr:putative kunitz-type protease inhibitor [Schistosoma mansoni]|eukprot:XP_018649778.1 putative kunitz-type protease inhibitor [Schistosoma mansoni]
MEVKLLIVLVLFVVCHLVLCASLREQCLQPPQIGKGDSNLTRFYYDKSKNQCIQFFYKGRNSDRNNFRTKIACEWYCVVKKRK